MPWFGLLTDCWTNKVGHVFLSLLFSSFVCEVSSFSSAFIPSATFSFYSTTCDELCNLNRITAVRYIMTDTYIIDDIPM